MTNYREAQAEYDSAKKLLRSIKRHYSWSWVRAIIPEKLNPTDRKNLDYLENRLAAIQLRGENNSERILNGDIRTLQFHIQKYLKSFQDKIS